jgi:hypothetical protein
MKIPACLVLILVATAIVAGCSSADRTGAEAGQGAVRVHYDYHESWSPLTGCYGKISGYAFNAGNASVENIFVNFNLVDAKTGTIRDSRSVFIGTMAPGQSGTFETVLDGECFREYRPEAAVLP